MYFKVMQIFVNLFKLKKGIDYDQVSALSSTAVLINLYSDYIEGIKGRG